MAATVYVLCLIASTLCAVLLFRGALGRGSSLLMWSAACFSLLALNNLLVVIDLIVLPTQVDLSIYRQISNLAAVSTLLYGFIREVA